MSYPTAAYGPVPVEVVFPPPTIQSRATIFFRILLVIPQFIVLFLFGIAAFVAVVIGWFAALVIGRLPAGIDRFLGGYVQFTTRVYSYLYFLTGAWPPFDSHTPSYPVHVVRASQPLNRWAVFFRFFLALPAGIVAGAVGSGMGIFAFVAWICGVVLGRIPTPFHLGFAAIVRFQTRYLAYGMLLTPTWPWGLFGDRDAPVPPPGWAGSAPAQPYGAPGPAAPPYGGAGPAVEPPPQEWSPPAPPPPPAPGQWPPPAFPTPPAPATNPWARYPHLPSEPPTPPLSPYEMVSPSPDLPAVTRLTLTPGAMVVVALALAIGVFGSGARIAFAGSIGSLGTAVNDIELSVDYEHVSSAVRTWDTKVQSCEANNDLACARQASQTLAEEFGHFGDQIGSLRFPGSAAADAVTLRQDAYRAQSELKGMAAASNGSGFFVAARNFAVTATDIDTRYQAVEQDLSHRF